MHASTPGTTMVHPWRANILVTAHGAAPFLPAAFVEACRRHRRPHCAPCHRPTSASAPALLGQAARPRPASQGEPGQAPRSRAKLSYEAFKHVFSIENEIKMVIISCILKCQYFRCYFREANVRNTILAKPLVWDSIIVIFLGLDGSFSGPQARRLKKTLRWAIAYSTFLY